MRKTIILSTILVVMLSISAFATDTRVTTMGENNMILLDEANISLFPSRLFDYPNLVVGEFGYSSEPYIETAAKSASIDRSYFLDQTDFRKFGVHWKFGSDKPWVLGTYLSNSEIYFPMVGHGYYSGVFPDWLEFYNRLVSNQRISLYYARQLGNNIFGFSFNKIHSSWKDEDDYDAGSKAEESFANYMFNIGMTMQGGLLDWSLGLDMQTFTDINSAGYDESKPKGGTMFHGNIRYFKNINPTYTIIPHASFCFGKTGAEFYSGDSTNTLEETTEIKVTEFQLGVGLQSTPATNVLMVLDFGVMLSKWTDDYDPLDDTDPKLNPTSDTYTTTTLPYFRLGFDADVFPWFDVRMGAATYWDNEKLEDESNSFNGTSYDIETDITKYRYSSNHTWVGGGFHFGRLHIDTEFNPRLFLDGFNFISGESNSMNWRISTAYEF